MNPLTFGCIKNERLRAIAACAEESAGIHLDVETMSPEQLFEIAFARPRFDISELSFSLHASAVSAGSQQYTALSVFPSRSFRHDAIYVRTDGPISSPAQLAGKRVGVRNYANTAAVVVRGLLNDEFGIADTDIKWIVGDIDIVERQHIALPNFQHPIDIQSVPGKALAAFLIEGDLDAIVHHTPPTEARSSAGRLRTLFKDPDAEARQYFERTRMFPIMHLVGIRNDVLDQYPELPRQLTLAFEEAGKRAEGEHPLNAPWCHSTGIESNRKEIDTLLRYLSTQGLLKRPISIDEMFPLADP